MKTPTVSVVIPNYNHARFLPRCLDALLGQSVLPDEIVVVDDTSTDNSREILRGYARTHPYIQVHCNQSNLGAVATMNRGLELSRGDYVCFIAADDEPKPRFLERTISMLTLHPQAGLCCGMAEWHCISSGLVWNMGEKMPRESRFLSPHEIVQLGRSQRLTLSSQNALFRRESFVRAGGWKAELKWSADCFITYVVAFRDGACFVPETLSVFYLHPRSYYRSDPAHRQTIDRFLQLLQSEEYADVAPGIAQSGILGCMGWDMARAVVLNPRRWSHLNIAFLRRVGRRCLEVVGRRTFPTWLAKLCLRMFYGRPWQRSQASTSISAYDV